MRRVLGSLQVILDGVNGLFVIDNLETVLKPKMKKVGVLGANKREKTLEGHDLGKDFLK